MARIVQQPLPDPPPTYDQHYFFRLVNALTLFMLQSTAQAESIAATFICTDPVVVDPTGQEPDSVPDTSHLPTGALYLVRNPSAPVGSAGAFLISIVRGQDQ